MCGLHALVGRVEAATALRGAQQVGLLPPATADGLLANAAASAPGWTAATDGSPVFAGLAHVTVNNNPGQVCPAPAAPGAPHACVSAVLRGLNVAQRPHQ
jgi:hypothetical protein